MNEKKTKNEQSNTIILSKTIDTLLRKFEQYSFSLNIINNTANKNLSEKNLQAIKFKKKEDKLILHKNKKIKTTCKLI